MDRPQSGREAAIVTTSGNFPNIEALVLFIARSEIVVQAEPRPVMSAARLRLLPAEFDQVDVTILEWIAAEGRRARRLMAPL
jgi:hypothetical protein